MSKDPNGFPYADDHPKLFHSISAGDPDKYILRYWFWCPGCKQLHSFVVRSLKGGDEWTFNKDLDNPTFNPSLGVLSKEEKPYPFKCHSYLENGKLRFLSDSQHELAGQENIPLPNLPENYWEKHFENARKQNS